MFINDVMPIKVWDWFAFQSPEGDSWFSYEVPAGEHVHPLKDRFSPPKGIRGIGQMVLRLVVKQSENRETT